MSDNARTDGGRQGDARWSGAIRSERVWLNGHLAPATIYLSGGHIGAVDSHSETQERSQPEVSERRYGARNVPLVDVGQDIIMPGAIDVHVHINEPGRTSWEGFETATRAAAAGGITTIVDMPLNCDPVITTVDAWEGKVAAAAPEKLWVNCALYAGVVPGHIDELDELLERGAIAGKAFMIDSGIGDFPAADVDTLREGMTVLARHGRPLLAHAEIDFGVEWPVDADLRRYANYLASRPPAMETAAIELLIDLCRETGCATHIVHLSAAEGIPLIQKAKAEGLPITVETAPHYLYFSAADVADGATSFKCAPPIRDKDNQAKIRRALLDGTIDLVATDHSPAEPHLKRIEDGNFKEAWGGISSLQWLLPITWTVLLQVAPDMSLEEKIGLLQRVTTDNPVRLLDLDVGTAVAAGQPANLIAWDPERQTTVTPESTLHRHPITPYNGERLAGRVTHTWVNGELAMSRKLSTNFLWGRPAGRLLL